MDRFRPVKNCKNGWQPLNRKINLPFLTSAENFTNITTDFYYRDEDNNKIMGLTRLNYKYKDREFKNNKIVFTKTRITNLRYT